MFCVPSGRGRSSACRLRLGGGIPRALAASAAGRSSCIIYIVGVGYSDLQNYYSGYANEYDANADDCDDRARNNSWPRVQSGGDPTTVIRCQAEEQSDYVSVHLARGQHLLQLRGGGVTEDAGKPVRKGPIGAGVLDWLYDSDFEAEETAELERRRNEGLVQGAWRRGESVAQCSTRNKPRMTITGRSGETSVTVCHRCMRDIPTADWEAHACTEGQGDRLANIGRVQRMISEWEARSTRGGARGVELHGGARVISISEALGIHDQDTEPPDLGVDSSGARVISIAQALAAEGRRSPRDQTPSQWFEMGLVAMAESSVQPEAAASGDQAPHDDWRTWGRDACQGCGMTSAQGAHEWRICRCGAWYCAACASGQCVHCPAARVWVDPEMTCGSEGRTNGPIGNDPRAASAEEPAAEVTAPRRMSPDEAQEARASSMKSKKERLDEKRVDRRSLARVHMRQGLRPGRERNREGEMIIASANVTCTTSLKDELEHGVELRRAHHILLQEHKLRGESLDAATTWAAKQA